MPAGLPDSLTQKNRRPPLDAYDVAIHLEVEGVTDQVARNVHGYGGTLAMADAHFVKRLSVRPAAVKASAGHSLVQYFRGVAFALPVLISAVVMIVFSISLWGGSIPIEDAAAVAIGTLSSFLVTGGIVQVMAWRVLFFLTTADPATAKETCWLWQRRGVLSVFGFGIVGWLMNGFFGWLPDPLARLALGFHVALGLLWLASGALYALEGILWIGLATALGLAAAGITHLLGATLYASQFCGLAVAVGVSQAAAYRLFAEKTRRRDGKAEKIPLARLAHTAAPYFLYGSLYYCFLFADRWIAWTGRTASETLPIFFRGDYEAGLDIALIAFVFGAGWVHASTHAFFGAVQRALSSFKPTEAGLFNESIQTFYRNRILLFLPCAGAVGILVYMGGVGFGVLNTFVMRKVSAVALVGFLFLVIGLWNASLFFAFSLPFHTLRSMGLGLVADLIVSYFASRMGHYSDAVYGFAAGALFFALWSTWLCKKEFSKADHLQFAASV